MLYFAEFAHVRRTGRPITGAGYQKLPNGPAPRRLIPVRASLIENGDVELAVTEFLGYAQKRLIPKRPANVSLFSDEELATIDAVLDDLDGLTGTQVSDLSHDEPGWRHARTGETIEYHMARVAREQVLTPLAQAQAASVADRYGLDASARGEVHRVGVGRG